MRFVVVSGRFSRENLPARRSRIAVLSCVLAAMLAGIALTGPTARAQAQRAAAAPQTQALPQRLTNQEFWSFITATSEPSGTFHSENLVSNEARFQLIVPKVMQMAVPGRAYVGVGSEQNFTYIAALKPTVVFIVDLRRGNLDLHLAYKALFEMSADRADFVGRLFARARPAGLTTASTPEAIFAAYARVAPSEKLFDDNLKAITAHLATTHGFAITEGDREGLRFVYRSWFEGGPDLRYQLTTGGGGGGGVGGGRRGGGGGGGGSPTYADLMTSRDAAGHNWSYLSTEQTFSVMKDLETRNMLVPVVGNFGGPKALRAVATYLRQHGQVVSAYYLSNVEQYLRQDNLWQTWCASAATLPVDAKSVFIRSVRTGGGFDLDTSYIAPEVAACRGR